MQGQGQGKEVEQLNAKDTEVEERLGSRGAGASAAETERLLREEEERIAAVQRKMMQEGWE